MSLPFFGMASMLLMQVDNVIVLGINAWIKPVKFFFSIWIFCWTKCWLMHHLQRKRLTQIYTWVVVVMLIEQVILPGKPQMEGCLISIPPLLFYHHGHFNRHSDGLPIIIR